VLLMVALIVAVLAAIPLLTPSGQWTGERQLLVAIPAVSIFSLPMGECINSGADNHVRRVRCDRPHDEQIFGKPTPGYHRIPYPDDALQAAIKDDCQREGVAYFGTDSPPKQLAIITYIPSEAEWNAGPQVAACTFWNMAGKLTGQIPH